MPVTDADPSLAAARIELLVLRASLVDDSTFASEDVVLSPRTLPQQVDHVGQALATASKPVLCTAVRQATGVIAVACETPTPERLHQHHLQVGEWLDASTDTSGIGFRLSYTGEPLLIYGKNESLRVSRRAFEKWVEDYVRSTPVGFAFRNASDDELTLGVQYVMVAERVDHSLEPRTELLTPESKRFIRELKRALERPTRE